MWVAVAIALALLALDQGVKTWVVLTLPEGRTIDVWGEFLQFRFVRNPGAAFSLADSATWVFTIVSAGVVAAILLWLRRAPSMAWAAALGVLLGGASGNLVDRLFREPGFGVGHVIDFILTPWLLPAIYNIADIAVLGGVISVAALMIWRSEPKSKTPEVETATPDAQ